jgi:hypothetical protein
MRRMLSPVSLRQLGQTESMADEDEFKKNQKIMAAKRTRKCQNGAFSVTVYCLLMNRTKNVPLRFFNSFRFSIGGPRSVSSILQSNPFMLKPAIQVLLTTSIVGGAHMSSSKNIYSF